MKYYIIYLGVKVIVFKNTIRLSIVRTTFLEFVTFTEM